MTVLVHFSGPSYSRSVELQAGAAPMEVGRDPQVAICLPDAERLVSRRHIALEWDPGGVKITVISKVNGLTTPRGEINPGETVVLAVGESGQIGHFTMQVQTCGPATAGAGSDADPFHVFAGQAGAGAAGRPSIFDDPFFQSPTAPQPASARPAALQAMGQRPDAGHAFSGMGSGSNPDPLAAFAGNAAPSQHSSSIDDFLGAPSVSGGGLGAAQMLKPVNTADRRLAVDHVHDVNLPVQGITVEPAAHAAAPLLAPAPTSTGSPSTFPAPSTSGSEDRAGRVTADPWADFAKNWVAPAPSASPPLAPAPSLNHALDDAFSSSTAWRVEDMPDAAPHSGPAALEEAADIGGAFAMPQEDGAPAGAAPSAVPALQALCRGIGIPAPQHMTELEWERLGASIRTMVESLASLLQARAELKREMRAVDRTMLGAQENNPLKSGMPLPELLQYLLFMPQGAPGYMSAQRALQESVADLRAHEFAALAAVRAAVEGAIREFDPGKLRPALLKGKRSIANVVDNARLWDLYTSHYAERQTHMADWLEQMFSRHFMPAYSRESERLRRESQPTEPWRDRNGDGQAHR